MFFYSENNPEEIHNEEILHNKEGSFLLSPIFHVTIRKKMCKIDGKMDLNIFLKPAISSREFWTDRKIL